MTKIITPHDHFFRSMMANQKVAREFFETHLPVRIKNIVDLDSLQLRHNNYVGEDLHEQISDLLFKVDFNNEAGYFYVLIEHQSEPQKLMPFRMLKYMIAIMDDHLKSTQSNTLPIVYPMIFYSGTKFYNYSMDVFDLFENRELALEILWQPCQLIDISKIQDDQFKQIVWYGTLAKIMKDIHKYKKNIVLLLEQVVEQLRQIDNSEDFGYINTVIRYCFVVGEVPDENEFREIIQRGLNKSRDEIMSYAEQLMSRGYQNGVLIGVAQGVERGIERGIEREKNEVAVKLLQRHFEPSMVAEVTGLSLTQVLGSQKEMEKLSS